MPDVASQAKIASAHAAAARTALSQTAARQNRADTPPDSAFSEMLDSATQPEPKPRASEPRRDEARATDDKSEPASSSNEKSDTAPTKSCDSAETGSDKVADADGAAVVATDAAAKPAQVVVSVTAAVLPETAVATDEAAKPDDAEKADPATDAAAVIITQIETPIAKPAELAVATALPVVAAPADGKSETPDAATPAAQADQPIKSAPVLPVAPQAAPADDAATPQAGPAKPHFAVDTDGKPAAPATVEAHAVRAAAAAVDANPADALALQPAAQPSNSAQTAATPSPLHTATQAGSPAAATATTQQAAATPIPLHAVAVEIAARATSGGKRFDIRLDPPELGKIDVRLDIDKHGQVTSRLIVEKAETLDLLRRDAPQLERALQDAGLKTSGDGLQFSLQQHMAQQDDNTGGRLTDTAQLSIVDETIAPDIVQRGYAQLAAARGGVDIRV